MVALRQTTAIENDQPPRPPLRLVRESIDPSERRLFIRKEVHAHVEGLRLDHNIDALRMPHLSLALRDLSLSGCSAIADAPLSSGERLSIYFPPQGARKGWDAQGRVVRCEPSGFGYRVAVAFDPLPAA